MKTLQFKFFAIFFFVLSFAYAQTIDFYTTDANQDGTVDSPEFNEGYTIAFLDWDISQDGVLDQYEFFESFFMRLDKNGDRNLSSEEWSRGFEDIYGDYLDSLDFSRYDIDNNENVSSEEFHDGFRKTEFFSSYDTNLDGIIEADELNKGVFYNLDYNHDGFLDRHEYDTYGPYYFNAAQINRP